MMTERKAKRIVAKASVDWLHYINPHFKPQTFRIDRACLESLKEFGFDAPAMVADLASKHYPRLSHIIAMGSGVACSEAFIDSPIKATWQIILMDGALYVSSRELLPFE